MKKRQGRGQPQPALDLYQQALVIFVEVLGLTHQYTAATWVGLGDADKARRYYLKALLRNRH